MNNKSKKINFNHSFIFFLLCNIFSLIAFKIDNFIISPLICLFLILSIGISHGSLDNVKGRKLFHIFQINNFSIFYIVYILIGLIVITLWIFIAATTVIHGFYRYSVIVSYKFGDLSFVYPIARGGSCLIIAIVSLFIIKENITALGIVGISITSIGLFIISFSSAQKFNSKAFFIAITTSILIAGYTILDGIAVNLSANAFTFIFWMLLLNGVPMLIYGIISKNGIRLIKSYRILDGVVAGICAIISYGLVVWSFQFIKVAYVSSIREMSIVLAAVISLFILKEKNAVSRIIPSIIIVLGVTILYFEIT